MTRAFTVPQRFPGNTVTAELDKSVSLIIIINCVIAALALAVDTRTKTNNTRLIANMKPGSQPEELQRISISGACRIIAARCSLEKTQTPPIPTYPTGTHQLHKNRCSPCVWPSEIEELLQFLAFLPSLPQACPAQHHPLLARA